MRLYFYADESDIQNLLKTMFEELNIKFILNSWFEEESEQTQFTDFEQLTNEVSSNQKLRMYFACEVDTKLVSQSIRTNSDKILHSVNHGVMPDTVRVLLGSKIDDKMILQSTIDGFCDTRASKALFRSLKKIVVANARKVGDIYLFAGAEAKHNAGWILTPNREAIDELHFKL